MSTINQLLQADVEPFPPLEAATPEGLIAIGGDLSPQRLIHAYSRGIFPWYSPGEPILWWSPDPRCIIAVDSFKPKRSLAKNIRNRPHEFKMDCAFEAVIHECAAPRDRESGTWISADMQKAYIRLNQMGVAHSAEIWHEDELVGGLYGVAIGSVFFGESMFSRVQDGSKMALVHLIAYLQQWGFTLVDCQVTSNHMLSLGAFEIPRAEFSDHLEWAIRQPGKPGRWTRVSAHC
ncbi:MAG: leucyl/phenylalanyl-tRNA--protein transferase [Pseudomonadota bacterium]